MTGDVQSVQRLLVPLCLRPAEADLPADAAEWNALLPLALFHGVAPLFHVNLKDRDLPDSFRAQLRALYAANSLRNEKLLAEQARILAAFSEKSIAAWSLRGPHLSEQLYGDSAVRQVADIDLLIHPEDLAACDSLLQNLGYSRQARGDVSLFRDAAELLYLREAQGSEPLLALAVDLQQRLLPYGPRDPLADRVRAHGLTPENLLLSLCVNQIAHRFARLKYVCDVAACLGKFSAALDWKNFLVAARELDFTPGIYLSLAWAHAHAAAPVPDSVLAALRPGVLTRRYLTRFLGADPVEILARGAELDGPAGAFAILACTSPGPPRLLQLWRLLFPPAAYLRQEFFADANHSVLYLYAVRLARKLPAALRSR